MSTYLYIEGSCGASGDMLAAALHALGGSEAKVRAALAPLAAEGLQFAWQKAASHGIAGERFAVELPESFGKDAHHAPHAGHGHAHAHRHLADVQAILARLPMEPRARALAEAAFALVAEAEAEAHGCAVEEVHFHEVGALDSIADIVATAVLFADLGVTGCVVEALAEGCGTVHCAHGELPVPVPAVLNIARKTGLPLERTAVRGERVTPTGIALAAAMRTAAALPERFVVRRVGIGVGERDFGCANVLRAMVIEAEGAPAEEAVEMEANLDDCTGEALAVASEKLLAAGALDVALVPCTMKKSRPGIILRALAREADVPALAEVLLRETTTIGLRTHKVRRITMAREAVTVSTPYGPVQAKRCRYGALERVYPESESVRAVAERAGVGYPEVFAVAAAASAVNS